MTMFSQMLSCRRCLKMKVLGAVNLYPFLSWKSVMYANTRLLKVNRNCDNRSCRNSFLSGGFLSSKLTLVNPNGFMLGHKTRARAPFSWWLLLVSGRKWQITGSKGCCRQNDESERSNLISVESAAVSLLISVLLTSCFFLSRHSICMDCITFHSSSVPFLQRQSSVVG